MVAVLQILFAVGVCGVAFVFLTTSYLVVAALLFWVFSVMFTLRERTVARMTGHTQSWWKYLYIPAFSAALAMIWPSVPFIIFSGRSRDAVARVAKKQQNAPSEGSAN
jgi:hypothetical protein